jgi:PmbA protein
MSASVQTPTSPTSPGTPASEAPRPGSDDSGQPGELLEIAERVAGWARSGEDVEVYVSRGEETEVRAYDGEVESLTSATSAGIGVRVVVDHKLGFAWAGSLDPSVLGETLEEARDNATYATPDEHVQLAVADGVPAVAVDLWDDGLASVPTARKVEMVLELERQTRAADPRIRQVSSADYGDGSVEVALASTKGIRASNRRTSGFVSVSVIAGDGAASQTGGGFSAGRGFEGLEPDRATADAVERAVRLLGATKGPSGRSTVVFDRRVATTLLSVISSALSGEAVEKGRSFFAGRLGEQVAGSVLTLVDDPTDPRAYGAAAYDAEGLACRRNVLVENGVLRRFLYDTVSASRAGTASTGSAVRGGFSGTPGPGCRALALTAGPEGYDQDGVLGAVGEGLFVQSVTGVHSGVNPISGDFSVGAEGLMIRNGALAEPVREITVASTLQRILQSVVAIGSDVEWLPGIAAGQTIAVGDMQISGV